jgi:hypothetical protein
VAGLLLRTTGAGLPAFAFATRVGIGISARSADAAADVVNARLR